MINKVTGYFFKSLVFATGILFFSGIVVLPKIAQADILTVTVDTTDDDATVNGNCTLREAITTVVLAIGQDACNLVSSVDPQTLSIVAFAIPGPSSVKTITLSSALPNISVPMRIDGATQTTNIGDSNSGQFGTGGTVGTGSDGIMSTGDEPTLGKVNKPEIEIVGNSGIASGFNVTSSGVSINGLAMYGFSANTILTSSGLTGISITNNLINLAANSLNAPTNLTQYGIQTNRSSQLEINNNLIAHATVRGVMLGCRTSGTIQFSVHDNEFFGSVPRHIESDELSGSSRCASSGSMNIYNNLVRDAIVDGVSINLKDNTPNLSILTTIQNNTIINSTYRGILNAEPVGNVTIINNIISNNSGGGVIYYYAGAGGGGGVSFANRITKNAIFDNGGLGIDLQSNDGSSAFGVNPNDGLLNSMRMNMGMDYPIMSSAVLSGSNLTITGYVGSAPSDTDFGNSTIEFFLADDNPANQSGEAIVGDGLSLPHGEGSVYLGSCVSDVGDGDFSCTLTVTGLGVSVGSSVTATATSTVITAASATTANNNTSEFSPNYTVTSSANPVLGSVKRVSHASAVSPGVFDVVYDLAIKNLSSVDTAYDVQLVDDLDITFPSPASYVIQAGPQASGALAGAINSGFNGHTNKNLLNGTIDLAPLAQGAVTFTVRVTQNGQNGPFNNGAVATASSSNGGPVTTTDLSDDGIDFDPDSDGNPNESGENDPAPLIPPVYAPPSGGGGGGGGGSGGFIPSGPDVMVTKFGAATASLNGQINYTIKVTNIGGTTANNVIVSDLLPSGLSFVNASNGGIYASNKIIWPVVDSLSPGGELNYSIVVTATQSGLFTNIASAVSTLDTNLNNNNGTNSLAKVSTTVSSDYVANPPQTVPPIINPPQAIPPVLVLPPQPSVGKIIVKGVLYYDFNNNGRQDDGDLGVAGIKVRVMDSKGGVYQVSTDINGAYVAEIIPGKTVFSIDNKHPVVRGHRVSTSRSGGILSQIIYAKESGVTKPVGLYHYRPNGLLWDTGDEDLSESTISSTKIKADYRTQHSAFAFRLPGPGENSLQIDSASVMATIHDSSSNNALNKGVWRLPYTSTPDQGGNTVLAAHRYLWSSGPNSFFNLDKVVIGETIKVSWRDKAYKYKVVDIKVVDPKSLNIEANTLAPTLTVYTCTPTFSSKQRLVVKAELVE